MSNLVEDRLVVLKLITGEEVVGEKIEASPDSLVLKNILAMETVAVAPGQLAPTCRKWILSEEKDATYSFRPEEVMHQVEKPAAFVRDMYRAVFSPIQLVR